MPTDEPPTGRIAVGSDEPGGGQPTATESAGGPAGASPAAPPPRPAFLPGETAAGRFRIVGFLGQGGMGQVFEAFDQELAAPVAIKVIRPDLAARAEAVERFRHEVFLARQVTHPNVCRIFDVQHHRGAQGLDPSRTTPLLLLSMELLRGETLARQLAREGPLPVAVALPLIRQMAAALEAAHQAGVVHRDFKPGNILLVDAPGGTRVVVTDFGVAGADPAGPLHGASTPWKAGGTPGYVAPEEGRSASTPQGDLYSFGLVVTEMLTGQRPQPADQAIDADHGSSLRGFRPRLAPDLDPALEDLLVRCLEVQPEDRPASASTIVAALDRWLAAPTAGVKVLVRVRAARDGEQVPTRPQLADSLAALDHQHCIEDEEARTPGGARFAFSRAADALAFSLRLARHGVPGMAIHLAEPAGAGIPAATRVVLETLADLAQAGQILLSRSAFELSRQVQDDRGLASPEAPGAAELRWLAHGAWAVSGIETPVDVFEVGEAEHAPFATPPDLPEARRLPALAGILGWRPAAGAVLPERPNWRLVRKLGEGGFGDVWLTVHTKTRERRVLKFCYDASQLAALRREITLFRLLREELGERDDVTRILDWNLDLAPYFIEAEYTAHGNLLEWLEAQGGAHHVPLARRLELVARVADALAAAHSAGVLHRDVKPANVLVGGDRDGAPNIHLTDFGIGRALERRRLEAAGITLAGLTTDGAESPSARAGTPLYMAPELLEGRSATVQADIYALGVMLFQLAIGDCSRALGPGWDREISHPLLVQDIAAAVDGNPARRPSAQQLAERLRTLDARERELRAAARFRVEVEETRLALAQARRRRRLALGIVVIALVFATGMGVLARRLAQEARLARDLARGAQASAWMARDPTRAALILLELERPSQTPGALALGREALTQHLAIAELRGHDGPVGDLVMAPHGRWLATAGVSDGTVRVWPLDGSTDPPMVLPEPRHDDGVRTRHHSLDVSPQGDRVAAASWDGVARIWTLGSDAPPVLLRGHRDRIWRARFSPDGTRVLTASDDRTARIWNADGSGPPIVLGSHDGWVFWASWAADGRRVVTAGQDGWARIWSATDGALQAVVGVAGDWLFCVELDPTGRYLATASRDGTIRVWNADGSGPPRVVGTHRGSPYGMFFSPDGERVISSGSDGTVRAWRVDGGGATVALDGPTGYTTAALGPDGALIAAGFVDGSIRVTTVDGRGPVTILRGHESRIERIRFTPDGRRLASGSEDGTVRIWPLDPPPVTVLTGHRGPISDVVSTPDGRRLASGSLDGTARVWTLDGSRPPAVLDLHDGQVTAVAVSPDGRWVATGSQDDTIRLWTVDGEPLARLEEHDDTLVDLSFLATPLALVGLSYDGKVSWRQVDARTGRPDLPSWVCPGGGFAATLSSASAGGLFAVGGLDGVVRLCDGHGNTVGDRLDRFAVAEQPHALATALTPDGRHLLAGHTDGTVGVWRLRLEAPGTPVLARVLELHTRRVTAFAFTRDGRRVATASADGTVRVWEMDGDAEPLMLEGEEGGLTAVAFTADGASVVTGGAEGTLRISPLATADPWQELAAATSVCLDPSFRVGSLGEDPAEARSRFERCQSQRGAGRSAALRAQLPAPHALDPRR